MVAVYTLNSNYFALVINIMKNIFFYFKILFEVMTFLNIVKKIAPTQLSLAPKTNRIPFSDAESCFQTVPNVPNKIVLTLRLRYQLFNKVLRRNV